MHLYTAIYWLKTGLRGCAVSFLTHYGIFLEMLNLDSCCLYHYLYLVLSQIGMVIISIHFMLACFHCGAIPPFISTLEQHQLIQKINPSNRKLVRGLPKTSATILISAWLLTEDYMLWPPYDTLLFPSMSNLWQNCTPLTIHEQRYDTTSSTVD